MSSINGGMWRAPQNTKVPAVSHLLSVRVTGVSFANGTTPATSGNTFLLPQTFSNPAQYSPAQTSNYAPSASPVLPSNEPQQGLRLYVTEIVARRFNGTYSPSVAGANIVVADLNFDPSAGTWSATPGSTVGAANTVIGVAPLTGLAAPIGDQSPYIRATVGQVGGDATTADNQGLIVVRPYDQLAIGVSGSASGTAPTSTAFTLDLFGYWAQTI